MLELLQIVGALLILAAFIALQLRRIDSTSYLYLILNAAGSAVLALLALRGSQWGFLLLEGTWAAVSIAGLLGRVSARAASARGPRP